MSFKGLNLWENFIESIAQVLSRALTDKETEQLINSFKSIQSKLRQLSSADLQSLEVASQIKTPYCKHKGSCSSNCLGSFIRSYVISYGLKYALGFFPAVLMGKAFKE